MPPTLRPRPAPPPPKPPPARKWGCAGLALQSLVARGRPRGAPARLDAETCRINAACEAFLGKERSAMLVERVLLGWRPMAVLPMRVAQRRFLSEASTRRVIAELGLGLRLVRNRRGAIDAVVFQEGARLADYYDEALVLSLYAAAGHPIVGEALHAPVGGFADRLSNEDFGGDVLHPLQGLLFGHPLHEAVAGLGANRGPYRHAVSA